MATRAAALPVLPGPPETYTVAYMENLVRVIALMTQQIQNPGDVVAASLTLVRGNFAFPTDDMGLPNGGVFNSEGFLKISQANVPHIRGVSGTGRVGAVSVTTT